MLDLRGSFDQDRAMTKRWLRVWMLVGLFAAAGCDADGKTCKSGEGADAVARWQACNRSCVDKSNDAACAMRKGPAATAACAAGNSSACDMACAGGDKSSCK
jgi:hypothetical protein